jgi:hypothetical protein
MIASLSNPYWFAQKHYFSQLPYPLRRPLIWPVLFTLFSLLLLDRSETLSHLLSSYIMIIFTKLGLLFYSEDVNSNPLRNVHDDLPDFAVTSQKTIMRNMMVICIYRFVMAHRTLVDAACLTFQWLVVPLFNDAVSTVLFM